MQSLDAVAFLADTDSAVDAGIWGEVISALADYASRERSGAQIRLAGEKSSAMISADGCAAWMVARFGEPAVIVIRRDLSPGLPSWHAARMLVALGGSPTDLEPREAGIIGSRDRPSNGQASASDEQLDHLAAATLRSMGVPRWRIRRISK